MLNKLHILKGFPNLFNKFNKTWSLMQDPIYNKNIRLSVFVRGNPDTEIT